METAEELQTFLALKGLDFDGYTVPAHTQGALLRYVYNRYSPGSFGEAMLAGDLQSARYRADAMNLICIDEIDRWIKEQLPERMRGSYKAVQNWCYYRKDD